MPELSEIYDRGWFEERTRYRPVYHAFADAVWELWRPRAVLDVGCGAGYLVEGFAGRCPALGVDGSEGARAVQGPEARKRCLLRDLTAGEVPRVALRLPMAVSIEVAEHIEPELTAEFVRWFGGCQRLLLTAAPPGQGGTHHVNEREPEFWRRLLAGRGLAYRPQETERWQQAARARTKGCPWVVRNAMVFRREEAAP